MKKILSAIIILAVSLVPLLTSLPAQASEGLTQNICNSSKSPQNYNVDYGSYSENSILPSKCKSLGYKTKLRIDAYSFRVAYNLGDYQGCQNIGYNSSTGGHTKIFTASTSPSTIYFKIYKDSNCKN